MGGVEKTGRVYGMGAGQWIGLRRCVAAIHRLPDGVTALILWEPSLLAMAVDQPNHCRL
ncbi:protein of unknown function [Pseudomonas mediterranea]